MNSYFMAFPICKLKMSQWVSMLVLRMVAPSFAASFIAAFPGLTSARMPFSSWLVASAMSPAHGRAR